MHCFDVISLDFPNSACIETAPLRVDLVQLEKCKSAEGKMRTEVLEFSGPDCSQMLPFSSRNDARHDRLKDSLPTYHSAAIA